VRLRLEVRPGTGDVAVFALPLPLPRHVLRDDAMRLVYDTKTGAVLRVDGEIRAAFDREHREVVLPRSALAGALTLEVERRSMPSTGLPSGDGPAWRKIVADATARPHETLTIDAAPRPHARERPSDGPSLALIGHSHLDVAWLWRFEETRRKAVRTLATVCRQLDDDPGFIFSFSQPQLYAWVAEDEPALFRRIRAHAARGRIDAGIAPMWVESDCNLPSGESLLRQLSIGTRFTREAFGVEPTVAWLPDSFGFANTLPTLLAHAGIGAFGTTKLGWNDTTPFPYGPFVWEGPDGARVVAAQIDSIQGEFASARIAHATKLGTPLLVGYGDGGGGVPDAALADAASHGRWTSLSGWFAGLAGRAAELPVVRDELYLEEHRGTYTTHRDVKARNAALERSLGEAELLGAWALALHASPFFLDEFRAQLGVAWEIVLRAQFHDVLTGSAIGGVFDDVHAEYDEAQRLVAAAAANARTVLPRTREGARLAGPGEPEAAVTPVLIKKSYLFENAHIRAVVLADGTLVELRRISGDATPGPNLVRAANRLVAYADHPKKYEAWNLDRYYRRHRLRVRFEKPAIESGGLEIPVRVGESIGVMRISLGERDETLRVELAIAWLERRTVLRVESETRLRGARLRFGSPHGTVERRLADRDPAERARFEVPGQRFARADASSGEGVAVLSLDGYGWSAHAGDGAARLGHSLLRGTSWPDAEADRGEHVLTHGFTPLAADDGTGVLEQRWRRFAGLGEVPMFTSEDPALLVVATKPAEDGDGVIVRIRECDGAARRFSLRCGARAREVRCVDAHEREIAGPIELVDGSLEDEIGSFALRAFRVRLA